MAAIGTNNYVCIIKQFSTMVSNEHDWLALLDPVMPQSIQHVANTSLLSRLVCPTCHV